MKNVIGALVLGVVLAGAAQAAPPEDPVVLLKTRLNAVVAILADKTLDIAAKEERISETIAPLFNFELMAKLTLGKQHWSKLAPEQQNHFTQLFVERLKDSYRDKLSLYSGEELKYKKATRKGTKIQIPTELIVDDKPIAVVYKMYQSKIGWKIYDIVIQGVSLVRTYKSQFDEILNKGTIEDLLMQLEKPLPEETPAPAA
ncbi:phospholipid-binding protein MlaC [Planctomycetota bacterium]